MTEEQMNGVVEQKNIRIKHLEREIKSLTKQNYDLMVRISELADDLRILRGKGVDSFT
jgi:hypothetical protein